MWQNNWLYNASGPNFEPPLEELNVYVITVNLGYEIMLNEKYMMLIFHLRFIYWILDMIYIGMLPNIASN